ncbi:alpha/beta fold hydrolase [Sneathiella glossodoripedis]|uniref:alpha/beta fold hydrolase n=1 Tax=Sneathiella glossodoripedis TaxID=418853 RepID=UPI00046E820E|nr:alpha/beta hydrolase [Sneathiella glossodoripedis]
MSYTEHFYKSNDDLNLYYRQYGATSDRLPVVCLSGLTRNSGDFEGFAAEFANDRQIFTLDYRGRGQSDWDSNYKNYDPQTYLADVLTFLSHAGIKNAIFIGTSLGGILSIALAGLAPQFVKALILNDIGPEVSEEGSSRIADYVGKDIRFNNLEDAALAQKEMYRSAYPDVEEEYWLETAGIGFVFDEKDRNYRANYDLTLGKALREQLDKKDPVDLWPFFESLNSKPVLAIRGELSDVLSEETFQKMQTVLPHMQTLTLPNRGHVPTLTEPACINTIKTFLDNLD